MSTELQAYLAGRKLLQSEIPPDLLEENNLISYQDGITKEKNQWKCTRCGNTNQNLFANYPCARCKQHCTYCRNCIMMGRVSTCTPLIGWNGPDPEIDPEDIPLQWDGQLSKGQQHASAAVVKAIQSNSDMLVWAVCGAGKTEVLFAGINEALRNGRRVCIATPRTDVVLELAPRFRKVFPATTISALYGGSEERHQYAQLVISTTHQLFRFENAFDVIIVDEVDAFPYTFDRTLQWAVEKAARQPSAKIHLTATPSTKWQKECMSGNRAHVTIPARFHRRSLPVPQFKWCGNWRKPIEKGKLPRIVEKWVSDRLQINKQALVFLPNIKLMEKAAPLFQKLHPKIESVHAEDQNRKEKVMRMRTKETPILLTTTILERGVTFPNIDVAVVGAEDRIFTEAALVQISGRVGRSADYPTGNITFFHYGQSREMLKAQNHIIRMNQEARKRGLIDG
ncbi:helicase [Heyndrickxia shackletonii]|uniref:Helicase n=1 Tax=Heyndrickxia shackletonii TaxID=157838 RepID=A0A0Q3WVW5_9BACI|nr:DEAD/DEAH box helicase [Heyndrickxia shackletonii]KQL52978.1 helicase [Heyndrickxia shackletonii]NEY98526.1 DEAD/DEAH box helicase [Heyndrickxia shackletonii]